MNHHVLETPAFIYQFTVLKANTEWYWQFIKVFKRYDQLQRKVVIIITLLSNKWTKVSFLQRTHQCVPSGTSSASALAPEKERCITPAGCWSIGVWFQMAGMLGAQCGAQHSQVDNNGNTQRYRCPYNVCESVFICEAVSKCPCINILQCI